MHATTWLSVVLCVLVVTGLVVGGYFAYLVTRELHKLRNKE